MHKVGFFRRAPVKLSPSIAVLPGKDKITHSSISPTRIFLIALSRHHPRSYCPSAEKDGVCMQLTRAKRRDRRKKQQHSAGASVPTSRTKNQAPIKADPWSHGHACGEFGSKRHCSTGAQRTSRQPPLSLWPLHPLQLVS